MEALALASTFYEYLEAAKQDAGYTLWMDAVLRNMTASSASMDDTFCIRQYKTWKSKEQISVPCLEGYQG